MRGWSRRRRRPRPATPGSSRSSRRPTSAPCSRPPPRRPPPRPWPTQALKDLQGGKAWDDVAKTISTDASTAAQAGDLGWIAGRRQADRRGLPEGGLRRRGQQADRGHRGRRRHLPDRPGHRDRARGGRRRVPGQDRQRRRSTSTSTGGPRGRRPPRQAPEQDRRRRHRARPAAHRSPRSTSARPTPGLAADAIKVRHILYSPKDDPPAPRRSRTTIRPGRRPTPGPSPPTPASRTTRACSTRSPASESDEAQAQGPTGTGGKLPFFDSTSGSRPGVREGDPRPGPQGRPDPRRRSSPPSAGTSSRSCTTRPTRTISRRSRTRPTRARTSASSPATTRTAPTAGSGGDLGWVAKGQLGRRPDRRDLRRPDRQDVDGRDHARRRRLPVQGRSPRRRAPRRAASSRS